MVSLEHVFATQDQTLEKSVGKSRRWKAIHGNNIQIQMLGAEIWEGDERRNFNF